MSAQTPETIREAVRIFDAIVALERYEGIKVDPTEAEIREAALAYADVLENYLIIPKTAASIELGLEADNRAFKAWPESDDGVEWLISDRTNPGKYRRVPAGRYVYAGSE